MNFEKYAHYYDMLYADKNYQQEAQTVAGLVRKYAQWDDVIGKKILSIGCGTGKHDKEFCLMGMETHGIDISEDMVSYAQRMANSDMIQATFETADACMWRSNKEFDAVVSLFHVASYQLTNDNLTGYIEAAASALRPGGIFLFDAWYGPGVLTDRPTCRRKVAEDDESKVIRFATPYLHDDTDSVDVCYNLLVQSKSGDMIDEIEETHRMRFFFQPEMRYVLNINGFRLLDVLDCNSLKKTGFNSWTAYFIAEKND